MSYDKYYFPVTGWDGSFCSQRCMVKNNGIMIGSGRCQECEFCVDKDDDNQWGGPQWIKCSKLDEAIDNIK